MHYFWQADSATTGKWQDYLMTSIGHCMHAYQVNALDVSSFLTTSAIVRSSSSANAPCLPIDSAENSAHKSPSITPLTGAYALLYARWSRPVQ